MEKHLTAFSRKYIYWLTTIERKTKPTESQNNVDGGYLGGRNLDWQMVSREGPKALSNDFFLRVKRTTAVVFRGRCKPERIELGTIEAGLHCKG